MTTFACKRQRSHENCFACDANICQIRGGNAIVARGAFGEISLVVDVATGTGLQPRLAVAKTVGSALTGGFGVPKKKLSKEVCNEIMALRILTGHPNIVSFWGLSTNPNEMMSTGLCLVFEYSPIDLHAVKKPLALSMIRFITKESLSALHHCHSNGIIHRDISPKNFLISSAGRVQLCDFGLAKACPYLLEGKDPEPSDDAKGLCTLYYRPPEILLGGPALYPSVDLYGCGLVVAELISGRPLLPGKNVLDQIHRTFQLLGTPSASDPWVAKLSDFSKVNFHKHDGLPLANVLPRATECPHLLDFLESLIELDPTKRSSAEAALKHVYITSLPIEASAASLIPTACKSVSFSGCTQVMVEQEALSLAASRRAWMKQGVNDQTLSIRECLQEQ